MKAKYLYYIFDFIRNKRKDLELYQERELVLRNTIDDELEFVKIALPRLQLNIDKIGLVKFSADLVYGLKLNVQFKTLLGTRSLTFESDVTYNEEEGQKFRRSIIERKGFIYPEENYFNLKDELVTKGTKVTTLINTRVILFYRSVILSEDTVKRVLSLGLLFLIKKISYAELFFEINKLLPNGIFNVSIKYVDNSYVLIGIELPIF